MISYPEHLLRFTVERGFHPSEDMALHLMQIWTIARFLPARRILEIGTDDGTSTVALLTAVADVGGHVESVDPLPCEHAHANVARLGLSSFWTHRMMTSRDAACLYQGPIFDLLFIDGDHSEEGVRFDWETYEPMVRDGGFVMLHDSRFRHQPGIRTLVEDIIRLHPDRWETLTMEWGRGLTVVRKVSTPLLECMCC